ncbi:MAG: hypothetical protein AB7P53_11090 [Candidatus Dadabacteria bacterium]
MRERNYLACSLPILFETGLEEYPYSIGGTCFIVEYKQTMFVITANHVIGGMDSNSILVPYFYGSRDFLPFNRCWEIEPKELEDDTDYSDLYILRIDEGELDHDKFQKAQTYRLRTYFSPTIDRNSHFFVRGYPKSDCGIDYQNWKIHTSDAYLEGVYYKRSVSSHCHIIRIISDTSSIKSLDGLSGSPIFCESNKSHNKSAELVGILLRGTISSRLVHFLELRVLYKALEELSNKR